MSFDTSQRTSTSTASSRIEGTRTRTAAEHSAVAGLAVRWTRARRRSVRGVRALAAWFGRTVTPAGWVTVVAMVVGLATALWLGWAEAASAGIVAAILLVVAALFVVGRRRYDVDLGIVRARVVAGDDASGVVTVRNAGRRSTLPGRVDVPMGDSVAILEVPFLRAGGEHRDTIALPTSRRGVIQVGPVRSVRIDPLGLFRLETQWAHHHRLYVHPRTVDLPGTGAGFVHDLEGETTRVVTDDDMAFHALREYHPGDPLKHIHGKSTAKTGVPMVRQFEETRRSRVAVVLSVAAGEYADADEFELAVSIAGSVGLRALRDGRELDVMVSEEQPEVARNTVRRAVRLPSVSRRTTLDALSAVDASPHMLGLVEVCELYAPRAGDVSIAVLVCGSTTPVRELRAAALRLPLGVTVLGVVADPGSEPSVRRVGDLRVLTVPMLGDLRHLLLRGVAA